MWFLYVYVGTFNASIGQPQFPIVFIENDGTTEEVGKEFEKHMGHSNAGYNLTTSGTQEACWEGAHRQGYGAIRGQFDFEKAINLSFVRVIPLNTDSSSKGMTCSSCNKYNEYAQANSQNGKFICWPCTNGY